MYRIMYRHEGMKRFASVVTPNQENTLVEARFTSEEVAEEFERLWFHTYGLIPGESIETRVERVRPSARCEYTIVA